MLVDEKIPGCPLMLVGWWVFLVSDDPSGKEGQTTEES